MGKRKWYTVAVGKEIGVFNSWFDVHPLVSGVPGALHESFSTEEEAIEAFERVREAGNTRVVGHSGLRTVTVHPEGAPQSPLLASSTNSCPQAQSVENGYAPQTSSASNQSSTRRGPIYNVTPPRKRSVSPPIVHPNVSYTRGASSSLRLSPRRNRQITLRTVVRTPPDLNSYPGDDEPTSSHSSSPGIPKSYTLQNPRVKPANKFHISSVRGMPTAPKRTPPIVVETPSHLRSYPSDDEYTSKTDSILSPLNSPRFFTSETLRPPMLSGRSPGASSRCIPKHSLSSPRRPASSRTSHPHQEVSVQSIVYHVSQLPGDHSQCQHTCPHCKITCLYTSEEIIPAQLSQSTHAEHIVPDPIHDPRSPMAKNSVVPGHVNSTSFGRPSPRMKLEEHLGALFLD